MAKDKIKLDKKVLIGKILGPWGIKGGLRFSITHDFYDYVANNIHRIRFFSVENKEFKFNLIHKKGKNLYVTTDNINDRNESEKLGKQSIYCLSSDLPSLGADEYYKSSLVGLNVVNEELIKIGLVIDVHNFGASDIIEVELLEGERHMLPFLSYIFPEITEEYLVVKMPLYI